MEEKILILDFGSQYTQLIARRIRELNIYCEIFPFNKIPEITPEYVGVILSGSPFSVHDKDSPEINFETFGNLPVLGICYGAQLIAKENDCVVAKSEIREYGRAKLSYVNSESVLMKDVELDSDVWMSHGDSITEITESFQVLASTKDVKVTSYYFKQKNYYGLQFHPEVTHTAFGREILNNFTVKICGCSQSWNPKRFVEYTIEKIRNTVKDDKVVLGLSGGVDSSVAAMLIHKAIGKNLFCVFVDNGLLRKNEFSTVLSSYKNLGLNVIGVDAKNLFYEGLVGKVDPEDKRKSIGKNFIDVTAAISPDHAKYADGNPYSSWWVGQGKMHIRDYDHDGDLDIIDVSTRTSVFVNNGNTFELYDDFVDADEDVLLWPVEIDGDHHYDFIGSNQTCAETTCTTSFYQLLDPIIRPVLTLPQTF